MVAITILFCASLHASGKYANMFNISKSQCYFQFYGYNKFYHNTHGVTVDTPILLQTWENMCDFLKQNS